MQRRHGAASTHRYHTLDACATSTDTLTQARSQPRSTRLSCQPAGGVQDELVRVLWAAAAPAGWRVRQHTASGDAPFSTTAAVFAATGVLVARHGPLLASAALLPPGAAVYELLPFNWEWRHSAELYRNLTRSTGHIHHFAWRPTDAKWAVYASPDDRHRYSAFRASECTSKCAPPPAPVPAPVGRITSRTRTLYVDGCGATPASTWCLHSMV